MAIVRVDLATRKLDTAAFFKIAKTKMNDRADRPRHLDDLEINPMPVVDDWAVLVGRIDRDRARTGLPHRLRRRDGARHAAAEAPVRLAAADGRGQGGGASIRRRQRSRQPRAAATAPAASAARRRRAMARQRMVSSWPWVAATRGGGGVAAAATAGAVAAGIATVVDASELPDYRPAFSAGSPSGGPRRQPLDSHHGHARRAVAGPIYDVVNRKGELVDRMQIPAGRADRRLRQRRRGVHAGARRVRQLDRAHAPLNPYSSS